MPWGSKLTWFVGAVQAVRLGIWLHDRRAITGYNRLEGRSSDGSSWTRSGLSLASIARRLPADRTCGSMMCAHLTFHKSSSGRLRPDDVRPTKEAAQLFSTGRHRVA